MTDNKKTATAVNRLFFALDLDEATKHAITLYRDTHVNLPFKPITPDNFHITLCFLGHVNNLQKGTLLTKAQQITEELILTDLSANLSPFTLLLDNLAWFKKPKIIYISPKESPNWLNDIAEQLSKTAKSLQLFQEDSVYTPHVSVYRKAKYCPEVIAESHISALAANASVSNTPAIRLPQITTIIKSFSLYQSISTPKGVCYVKIKTYNLSTT